MEKKKISKEIWEERFLKRLKLRKESIKKEEGWRMNKVTKKKNRKKMKRVKNRIIQVYLFLFYGISTFVTHMILKISYSCYNYSYIKWYSFCRIWNCKYVRPKMYWCPYHYIHWYINIFIAYITIWQSME